MNTTITRAKIGRKSDKPIRKGLNINRRCNDSGKKSTEKTDQGITSLMEIPTHQISVNYSTLYLGAIESYEVLMCS
mgnify:CR=1 FL=1